MAAAAADSRSDSGHTFECTIGTSGSFRRNERIKRYMHAASATRRRAFRTRRRPSEERRDRKERKQEDEVWEARKPGHESPPSQPKSKDGTWEGRREGNSRTQTQTNSVKSNLTRDEQQASRQAGEKGGRTNRKRQKKQETPINHTPMFRSSHLVPLSFVVFGARLWLGGRSPFLCFCPSLSRSLFTSRHIPHATQPHQVLLLINMHI